jgi:hypothetical protein
MTELGQEDQFRPPSLNGGCWLGKPSFAGMGGKEEDAPIQVIYPTRRMWSGFSEADVRDPTSSAGDFGSRFRRLCGATPV